MNALHDDLLCVLDAVEIESPTRYRLRGPGRATALASPVTASGEAESKGLVESLAKAIYDTLYTRPCAPASTNPRVFGGTDLTIVLSAANTGKGTWEPGWFVDRFDSAGSVVVTKNGVSFWVSCDGLRAGSGNAPRIGESCRVWVPNERRNENPGFYVALGDADEALDDPGVGDSRLLRYYWHLTDRIAIAFVARATAVLNASQIPFRLKVLSEASAFTRADAGVLYVSSRDQPALASLIPDIYSAVSAGLRHPVPMFTRRLADGLAFAEDPGVVASFGEHRCHLVAEALWRSCCRGELDREARAATMAATFVEAGLDPLEPYLGVNSPLRRGAFAIPFPKPAIPVAVAPRTESQQEPWRVDASRGPFLETAARIGAELCKSAVWDRGGRLCNWIGSTADEDLTGHGPLPETAKPIGPDLYAGSAGIALFLVALHQFTGDGELARTASGAIFRSLHRLDGGSPDQPISPLSWYCGDLGVAYVARRVGLMTQNRELTAAAEAILGRLAGSFSQPHDLDLIGGNSGAIPVLLALATEAGLEQCHDLALLLGDELLQETVPQAVGCGWHEYTQTEPAVALRPLTGLSHGAAGIGLALFETYAASGRLDFLECARSAFAYEDSLFEPSLANWPDLRRDQQRPDYHVFWCHGAPGIALSRLRAAVLDPDRAEVYLAKARLGLATTLDAIEEAVEAPRWDTSLCHGLSGLGEVTLIAGQMLKESSYCPRAAELGRALIDRYAESGDWPSGVPSGGPNPSLMLGLAGVGYWFLRLHDPAGVASVLLLRS